MMGNKFHLSAIAITISMVGIGQAHAITIDKYFTVNPIDVCNNAGGNCATVNTYTAQTKKIYAQANVLPVFLPTTQINNTSLQNPPSVSNFGSSGNGRSSDPSTLNVWFANSMPNSSGTLYGEAWLGGNGVAINTSAVNSYNGGIGRMDTVAHELGHNLGLGHSDYGAGGANNLMTAGSVRSIPNGIGNIAPDGSNLDQLTAAQVTELRSSPFMKTVPHVQVDINGSTPFDTNNFFKVSYLSGDTSTYLKSLTIDLSLVNAFFDSTDTPPGTSSSMFATSNFVDGASTGFNSGDVIALSDAVTNGQSALTLNFTNDKFKVGNSFGFGNDIDLFSCIDCFGATPAELAGALFSFVFSDGFGSTAAMSGTSFIADSTDIVDLNSVTFDSSLMAPPSGFQDPGQGTLNHIDPVPEPGSLYLMLIGLSAFGWSRGRRFARLIAK